MATETKGKNTAVLTGRRSPWEMLGEALVMGGVDDLIFQYRLLKKAVKRGSGIELAAKQAEYEESFFFSPLYGAITAIKPEKVISHIRQQVGLECQDGTWIITSSLDKTATRKEAAKFKNIEMLGHVYSHRHGCLKGWRRMKAEALQFHGVNGDITEAYFMELVDRFAPGWRHEHNLHDIDDICRQMMAEGYTNYQPSWTRRVTRSKRSEEE